MFSPIALTLLTCVTSSPASSPAASSASSASSDAARSERALGPRVRSRYRAKNQLITYEDDEGEVWRDYRVTVRGPGRALLWSHPIPPDGAGAMVAREDGEAVLVLGEDDSTATLLRRGQAPVELPEIDALTSDRAFDPEAKAPSGAWLLSGPTLHEGGQAVFTTRQNWRFTVDLADGAVQATRVPQPLTVAGETLLLEGFFIGYGEADFIVHDRDGVSVRHYPGETDPVRVLAEGDYDPEAVRATEIWGREAAEAIMQVTMGCAVRHEGSVLLFELDAGSVSGCDLILLAAEFEPILELVFGDDRPQR